MACAGVKEVEGYMRHIEQVIKHQWALRKPAAGEEFKGVIWERVVVEVAVEGQGS